MDDNRLHVFISYSTKDANIASRVRTALEDIGLRCWMDCERIQGGEDIIDRISDVIPRVEALVIIISRNTNSSRHVKAEVRAGFDWQKILIPILVDNTTPARGLDHMLRNSKWLSLNPASDKFSKKAENIKSLIEIGLDNEVPKRQFRLQASFMGCTTTLAFTFCALAFGTISALLIETYKQRNQIDALIEKQIEINEALAESINRNRGTERMEAVAELPPDSRDKNQEEEKEAASMKENPDAREAMREKVNEATRRVEDVTDPD